MLVGDSVADTFASGLRHQGLDVVDAAFPGCKVVRGTIRVSPTDLRDNDCPWETVWPKELAAGRPRVVLLESAAFELWDVRPHGTSRWLAPGTPEWARYWKREMQQAIDTLTSTGAAVVIPTVACTQSKTDNGSQTLARSAFNPARVRAANRILRQLAVENADRMLLVDLNGYVCPGGTFRDSLHGVDPLRVDGVHYSTAGSDLVGRWLAPQLAVAAHLRTPAPATTTVPPPAPG